MNRALAISATGMAAEQANLDIVADNLANADVPGFKAATASFTTLGNGSLGTALSGTHAIFSQGKLMKTGGPFDVALQGHGFFVVERDGARAYTRAGAFERAADGRLQNADGWHLAGVRIPSDAASVVVAADGKVSVRTAHGVRMAGRITPVAFDADEELRPLGAALFAQTTGSGRPHALAAGSALGPSIVFGALERSNVSVVESMMAILASQRAYEANAKGVHLKRQYCPAQERHAYMKEEEASFRVAIYARVSTPGQAERALSIPEQIDAVQQFCDLRGWPVVAIFKDSGISGEAQVRRTEFQRMLAEGVSAKPRFDLILTRDASRFGRGDHDAPNRARLRLNGVRVDNIESPVGDMKREGMSPGEGFTERVKSAVDILQREEIPARVIASQRRLAREGGLPGRQGTMYGYRAAWVGVGSAKPKRTVELDPIKAPIVREMFERYVSTGSIKSVTRWLNELAIPSPGNGVEWYDTTVRSILSNETALGRIIYGRIRKVKNPKTETKSNVKNTGEVTRFDDAFPPLIAPDLFERAQKRLAQNERRLPSSGNPGNTLRGIGRCHSCGWHLAHQRNSSTGEWYYMCGRVKMHKARNADPKCIGILQASYVDDVVRHFLKRTLHTRGFRGTLQRAIVRYNEAATEYKGLDAIALVDQQIASLAIRCRNFTEAIASGGARLGTLLEALSQAEQDLAAAQKRRNTLAAVLRVDTIDHRSTLNSATKLRLAAASNDRATMKALLPELVQSIEVDFTLRNTRVLAFSYSEGFDRFEEAVRPGLSQRKRGVSANAGARFEITGPVQVWRNGVEGPDLSYELSPPEKALHEAIGLHALHVKHGAIEPWERLRGSPEIRVHSTTGAPLRFVAKWDLSNLQRIADEALRRIGAAVN